MEHHQLPVGSSMDVCGEASRPFPAEEPLGVPAPERPDHGAIITPRNNNARRYCVPSGGQEGGIRWPDSSLRPPGWGLPESRRLEGGSFRDFRQSGKRPGTDSGTERIAAHSHRWDGAFPDVDSRGPIAYLVADPRWASLPMLPSHPAPPAPSTAPPQHHPVGMEGRPGTSGDRMLVCVDSDPLRSRVVC